MSLVDGDRRAGDRFRIRIWNASGVLYDSGSRPLGGGSIVVHRR